MSKEVLVGCEESQAVTIEFRKLGIEAYSCDLIPCSGNHPEWHIQDDVLKVIRGGYWKMLIGHPPCTYITVTANKWLKDQPMLKSGALVGEARRKAKAEAEKFFLDMWNCGIEHICLENPIGSINKIVKPTQIIHPYYFGDEARKATCLWLKNLPPLYHNESPNLFDENITHVDQGESAYWTDSKTGKLKRQPLWYARAKRGSKLGDHSKERSKTFPSIAKAMAAQWSQVLIN